MQFCVQVHKADGSFAHQRRTIPSPLPAHICALAFLHEKRVHHFPRRYIWESKADGSFAISEDTEGEPLGRGTQINIYLKVGLLAS